MSQLRKFITTFFLLSLVYNPAPVTAKPFEKPIMTTNFSHLATEYERRLFEYTPELGIFFGKDDVAMDRFTDYSLAATERWQQQEDGFLDALAKIDEKSLQNTSEYYTYLLLKETLENNKQSRVCQEHLWDVNPAFGWHNKMAIVAEKQPVGTASRREAAIKRWLTFKNVVDVQIDNLKLGLQRGYTAPKPAVKRVIAQLTIMLDSKVEDSPFFEFAKRDGDANFKNQIRYIVNSHVNPAIKKYITYLEKDYLPKTRDAIGVSALPDGNRCYQTKILQETTLCLSAVEIHKIGLASIEKLSSEITKIGRTKYNTTDIKTIFETAKNESLHYFSSEEDILQYNLAALARVKAVVPRWFEQTPKADGIIKPYPPHRAKTGASGEYHPPSEDGTEPGVFFINTFDPPNHSRIDMEATLFHELIPGHHFQVALNHENKTLPPLNKYLWNPGYGEGWALYVERLADEMSLYCDDVSRLGMLSNESLRASRLVVDTGIHAMNWTRQQAVDYLTQHTALDPRIIEGEVDRYIMLPAQATSYMLGKNHIESLREKAKKELGKRFDIRHFHNQVLNHGAVSLPILTTIVEDWIKEEKQRSK